MKTLTRSTTAALILSVVLLVALPRRGSLAADFVDVFSVAFCFTFIGHYVERLLSAIPGIERGAGQLVHLAGWFAGGLWCFVVARWLWIKYGRDLNELPGLVWGGVFLVVLQLIMGIVTGHQKGVAGRHDATLRGRKTL